MTLLGRKIMFGELGNSKIRGNSKNEDMKVNYS